MRMLLAPFSLVYYLIAAVRNFFYDKGLFRPRGIGARVISVGNITWGGTGKTPAVIFIANSLLRNKKQPAILTRGYGNDEKTLLTDSTRGIPVITGSDRLKTGRDALNRYSLDTILLDDAFQHRRVKRDLDIVCIDATDPFGNRMVIPAGSMREGIGGLKRADIFLLTKVDLVKDPIAVKKLEIKLKDINPCVLIVKSVHKPKSCYKLSDGQLIDMGMLRDKGIALVSAIG
ncbi:MAG: tetraacyldisaccharide 4'-kinase, partial [Candidatus Omnitrophica bacterium]|nr:tetraacyldisaccharide 4'-kinase [Candidatus Omnitrophota bacterium]